MFWVVFFVTHILYDSPESAFALSARRYFAFSSGEVSSQCHLLFFVKYRLFHVIYKTVNDFMQSKLSHLTSHIRFFWTMKVLFLLLKCLFKRI